MPRSSTECSTISLPTARCRPELDRKNVTVEPPRDPAHGDLATNAAMVLAKPAGTNPRALAELIKPKLEALPPVDLGRDRRARLHQPAPDARRAGATSCARSSAKATTTASRRSAANERVNVEYVSANPTGPMHMGHCRGAVVGDSLARLLEAAGFRVTKEYYVNDAGAQVDTLARSVHLRYREALGEDIGDIPEGMYPGDYLKPVGDAARGRIWRPITPRRRKSEWLPLFRERGDRGDARPDPLRPRPARHPPRHVRVRGRAAAHRARSTEAMEVLRDKGLVYEGDARAAQEPRSARRMGAGRADPVPLDPVRRRPGPADEEVGRQLDLFRRRRRLSLAEGARAPTSWSTSGAPTMPGRSSASRRR